MQGKAMEFLSTRDKMTHRSNKLLKQALNKRYGYKDMASVNRKELFFTKQKEGETLEEYAEQVYRLTSKGYPNVGEHNIQEFTAEAFLHGCRDKLAALSTADHKPKTLNKAVKWVNDSIHNQKSLGKHHYSAARQVTFNEVQCETRHQSSSPTNQNCTGLGRSSDQHDVVKAVLDELMNPSSPYFRGRSASGATSRSPSPASTSCYRCGQKGHWAHECPKKTTPSSSPGRGQGLCFKCSKSGHTANGCPNKPDSPHPSPSRKLPPKE